MPSRGVFLIVTGAPFTRAAMRLVESIRARQHTPYQIAVATDVPEVVENEEGVDVVKPISNPHKRSKMDLLSHTPFERTLYLDADMRVHCDLGSVFDVLDQYPIAATHARNRERPPCRQTWRIKIPDTFPQINGGLLAYRKDPAVLLLWEKWARWYKEAGIKKDQVTLRELLWDSGLPVWIIPPEWNAMVGLPNRKVTQICQKGNEPTVRIEHGRKYNPLRGRKRK